MTDDPVELDPELDAELVVDVDDEDAEDDLSDGFVVEGDDIDVDDTDDTDDDEDGDDDDDDDDSVVVGDAHAEGDEGSTVAVAVASEEPDEFEDDVAPVARVLDDVDDAPGRQSGEFICTSCFMVKKDSQMAVRSRKVCRDCA